MPIVQSTAVERLFYDPGSASLDICYAGGRCYRYFGVPIGVYRELLEADSIGRFVNDRIKGSHPFEELRASKSI